MKKKKVSYFITTLSLSIIAATMMISCNNNIINKTNPKGNIFEIFQNKKKINVLSFKNFFKIIKNSNTKNNELIENIFNVSNKYLYTQEQKASVLNKTLEENWIRWKNKNIKNQDKIQEIILKANIKTLKTEQEIRKNIEAKFKDILKAYKDINGEGWEKTWPQELINKYKGSASNAEAIDKQISQEMKHNAYLRYVIQENSNKFTKEQLELGKIKKNKEAYKKLIQSKKPIDKIKLKLVNGYEWLANLYAKGFVSSPDKEKTLNQLLPSDYISIISTGSYVNNKKDVSTIIGEPNTKSGMNDGTGYLGNFDPIYVNHFLIKALPNTKNRLSPWKIEMKDLKSILLSYTIGSGILNDIYKFKGVKKEENKKDNTNIKWIVSQKDKNLLQTTSNNSEKNILSGGSLGVKDYLSYVKEMVPGFSIPMLNAEMKKDNQNKLEESEENPLYGLTEKIIISIAENSGYTKINKEILENTKSIKEWRKIVDELLSNNLEKDILNIAGIELAKAFGNKNKYRYVSYGANKDNMIVLSKFGIHIMNINKITGKKAKKELISMIQSDSKRKVENKEPFFKIIKELNKYYDNKDLILQDLLNESLDFKNYLKTNINFNNLEDNEKYNDNDILKLEYAIKSSKQIKKEIRSADAVKNQQQFINDNYYKNELLEQKKWSTQDWVNSVNNLYNIALKINKEGVLKDEK